MVTAEQIKAARVLLRLDQAEVARRANVSIATLRRVESPDSIRQVAPPTVQQVRAALERSGVEFLRRGVVQTGDYGPDEVAQRLAAIQRAVAAIQAIPAENPDFSEDDLYDENGLPA